jgi:hypothetical protein
MGHPDVDERVHDVTSFSVLLTGVKLTFEAL